MECFEPIIKRLFGLGSLRYEQFGCIGFGIVETVTALSPAQKKLRVEVVLLLCCKSFLGRGIRRLSYGSRIVLASRGLEVKTVPIPPQSLSPYHGT